MLASWERLGECPEGQTFVDYGRVVHKQVVWDEDDELDNRAFFFVVDSERGERVQFRASPVFKGAIAAQVGDRIRYEYLLWDAIYPVDVQVAPKPGTAAVRLEPNPSSRVALLVT